MCICLFLYVYVHIHTCKSIYTCRHTNICLCISEMNDSNDSAMGITQKGKESEKEYMHIYVCMHAQLLNCIWLFVVPWTRFLWPWDFPGKNIGVGCHFLFQGIFLIQELNLHLLHGQVDSSLLSHQGRPISDTHKHTHTYTHTHTCAHGCVLVIQSYSALCNPTDCSLPGSSVHGILQALILEWVAILFSRGFS